MLRETVLDLRNVALEMPWFAAAVLLSVALCVGVNASILGEAEEEHVRLSANRADVPLGMLDDQWRGELDFAGEAVHRMKRKQRAELARRKIGVVFQSYHLLDDLTVAENIDLSLTYKDIQRSERQALVADTLDRFQIVGKKDLYPHQLSGGQQQLVGIARAMIHKPALLLADEPTGNLQSKQAKEIMEMFRQLDEEGTTIVQVTHSEANAAYDTRTIELRDGWVHSDTAGVVEDMEPEVRG
jgi:putative ABC transport system ATP-binding protein